MQRQPQLLPIVLLLLLCLGGGRCDEHDCPAKSVSRSKCRSDGLQSLVITHYQWNHYLKRCQRKLQLKEVSCDKSKAKQGVCPEPRTVEPGECDKAKNQQKTLVIHYEPDGKGGCVMHKDYVYPKCPERKPGDSKETDDCPEPRYFQKPCSGRHRQVFKFSYVRGKAEPGSKSKSECIEKTSITLEACGAFVPAKECPSPKIIERGACKNGFRTLIRIEYSRDPAGKCRESSQKVTQSCVSKKQSKCPPKRVNKIGSCKDRVQRWLTVYFEWSKLKSRCVRKFRVREKPCGNASSGGSSGAKNKRSCPKQRVIEPGPCKDGKQKVLIQHYEYSEKLGRCVVQSSFVTKKCGSKAAQKKSTPAIDPNHECPEKTVSQSACRKGGYRTVTTVYFVFIKALKRCVRKVKQEDEKCALLVKNSSCPEDVTQETGPCVRGYRTNIVYTYKRDLEGRCKRESKKITVACFDEKSRVCPPKKVSKVGGCKDRVQRWLTVYFEWSKLKGRCVRKFRAREKPCGGAKGGADSASKTGKRCPKRRVMEPGPCKDGVRKVLIQHYEYSEKLGRCVIHSDFVSHKCGKPTKRQAEAAKHNCPKSTYDQKECRKDGYRSVVKTYYRYNAVKGRCVRNVRVDNEKCSRLVTTRASCKVDEMVEEGPCKGGYRQNIVYRYERNENGRCVRKESRVTVACVARKVVP